LVLCLAAALGVQIVRAEENAKSVATFVLTEHLNQTWANQLVSFRIEAAADECHRDSISLLGPEGPLAFQLTDIELWPGEVPFVKSASIWRFSNLAPLESKTFKVKYGRKAFRPAAAPKTDLRVALSDGVVELATSRFGVRLSVGEKSWDTPANAEAVPSPVVALRLSGGKWFAGGRLFGAARIRSWSGELVATGPIFAEAAHRYVYENGNTMGLRVRLAAGDSAVLFDADVEKDEPGSGWHLVLNRGLPKLVFPCMMEAFTWRPLFKKLKPKWNDVVDIDLATYPAGLVTNLSPWSDWADDYSQITIPLKIDGAKRELRIDSRDPGAWVDPEPVGAMASADAWWHKYLPVEKAGAGEIFIKANNAAGRRKWAVGEAGIPEQRTKIYYVRFEERQFSAVGRRLNVVKDYVLDWKRRPGRKHPLLFMPGDEVREIRERVQPDKSVIQRANYRAFHYGLGGRPNDSQATAGYLLTGDEKLGRRLVERLQHHLSRLGQYDMMRNAINVVMQYDAVIDSVDVPEETKRLMRAQMAYLGYKLADPRIWSIERGYKSGNPNMSASYVLTLGTVACLLPDHPMSKQWGDYACQFLRKWLKDTLGPEGEWHESSHYTEVTFSAIVPLAVAARRAGFFDFFRDPDLKKAMMWIAEYNYTPRDPARGNHRATAPLGRSNAGKRSGLFGLMAWATKDTCPEYSRIMQWAWQENGCSRQIDNDFLGGYEHVCMDPDLPAENPSWTSKLFPNSGAVLRSGVGTEHENYLNIFTTNVEPLTRASEPGTVMKVFAKGRPIGGCFTQGYNHRQELLTSRVLLARAWQDQEHWFQSFGYDGKCELVGFGALPRMDYVAVDIGMYKPMDTTWYKASKPDGMPEWPSVKRAAKPPVDWRRQVLFVKDDDPGGVNYFVFRDTVTSNQPTMWQFWTLSEKVGTPEEAADLEAFLADKPGKKPAPARELSGDRYTAIGQFDVDLEYYVASPARTPRHALRFGDRFEHMDLLHLQLEGAGHYFVALCPRLRTQAAPEFKASAKRTVIRLKGDFGTDYVFLSEAETRAKAKGATFEGTAASVQDRKTGLALSLGAKGRIKYRAIELAADGPAGLRVHTRDRVELMLPNDHAGATVAIRLPGRYKCARPDLAANLTREGKTRTLTVPAAIASVILIAE